MSGWIIFFWLINSFLLIYFLKRWISTHIHGVVLLLTGNRQIAMWLFWALFLPGTFLHEVSHWLIANLLNIQTGKLSLWPKLQKGGGFIMGTVELNTHADPFRHSLIGIAPLIFGTAAILIIGQWQLQLSELGLALSRRDFDVIRLTTIKIVSAPDVWLWFYLIFAISNVMLPSPSDRQFWPTVLIYLGIVVVIIIGLDLTPAISYQLQAIGLTLITNLLYAFIITIAVDVLFVLLILFIETGFALIFGRRIQYN